MLYIQTYGAAGDFKNDSFSHNYSHYAKLLYLPKSINIKPIFSDLIDLFFTYAGNTFKEPTMCEMKTIPNCF